MKTLEKVPSGSLVADLLKGRVRLDLITPFFRFSPGQISQLRPLIDKIRAGDPSADSLKQLGSMGLLQGPESWSPPVLARVLRELGAHQPSMALRLIVHLALGTRLVERFGRTEQSSQLRESQEALCAFGLTEASPGSDLSRIQTYAEKTEDGFVLSGVKHWVTNGREATHFIVLARTTVPRSGDKPRLTAFLVPRSERVVVTPLPSDVLKDAGVSEVRFHDVMLEPAQILGQQTKGFVVVMRGLSEGRALIAAAVLGGLIRAFNDTVGWINQRRAFGRPVGRFPSVQAAIAGMSADVFALESLVFSLVDRTGNDADAVELGALRLAASMTSARVLDSARQLHGAAAFVGDFSASRRWADVRALCLLDGSDHALQSFLVLESTRQVRQRLNDLHEARDPLVRVDAAAGQLWDRGSAEWGRLRGAPGDERVVGQLPHLALRLRKSLHQLIDTHGREFVEKQHAHRRLAQVVADLCLWSAVAARVSDAERRLGEVGSRRMRNVAAVWTERARIRVEGQLRLLEENNDDNSDAVARLVYGDGGYGFDVD